MRFHKAEFRESAEMLNNPGCGWYHVYTFMAKPPEDGRHVEEEIWLDESFREEQLALVLVDIGSYRTGMLPAEACHHVRDILDFFHREGKQMILRFVYDREGKGMQKEPFLLSTVKDHMEQIGGIIRRFAQDILVVQGIFVGNWGEMHGSRFLDDASMCELLRTLYRSTEGSCVLAVRTPAQWRAAVNDRQAPPAWKDKLALFNDGIFGSSTDLGTYSAEKGKSSDAQGRRSRAEELEWQDAYMGFVPNGGEVLDGAALTGYAEAAEDLKKMHVSYLNSAYQQGQLEHWKQEKVATSGCWAGVSGYDYIGCHLGYRFVLRDACLKSGKTLQITVENCGFANLYDEADCWLSEEREGREEIRRKVETDARQWMSGKKTVLEIELPMEEQERDRMLFLRLERRRDGRNIRFANEGAGEKALIGEIGRRRDKGNTIR